MSALQFVVQTLDFMVPTPYHFLQLTDFDIHQLDRLCVIAEDVFQLCLVFPGVGFLYVLNFSVLSNFQLIDVLVELGNLVHQALIPCTVLARPLPIFFQKPILFELYFLQGLHFLGNLLI